MDLEEWCEETGGRIDGESCIVDGTEIEEPIDGDTQRALHKLQLAREQLDEAYGSVVRAHHDTGGAMDKVSEAADLLEEAGHDEHAESLRDETLPRGAVDDMWTYEVSEKYREGFLHPTQDDISGIRDDLADGLDHVSERRQQVKSL